jgi:hypothetical protein
MSECYNWWKGLQKPSIYFYEVLCGQICKNVSFGLKSWGKANKNGTRHVKISTFTLGTWILQWR